MFFLKLSNSSPGEFEKTLLAPRRSRGGGGEAIIIHSAFSKHFTYIILTLSFKNLSIITPIHSPGSVIQSNKDPEGEKGVGMHFWKDIPSSNHNSEVLAMFSG